MKYRSTRSTQTINASQAILNGLSSEGGLYVPKTLMSLPLSEVRHKSYQEIATIILSYYFDDIDKSTIENAVRHAYNDTNFSHPHISNLLKLRSSQTVLELFYGQTCAFKDHALSIYPYLLKAAMQKHQVQHLTILTATSGDTGKAAMEAVKDVAGLAIIVLYPKNGTSTIQKIQMQSQMGSNVLPIGIDGCFDDCQSSVKSFFNTHQDLPITSANSINIARLLPQVIYYYDAFVRMNPEECVDVYVPTGNFGNALAAYLAKEMGLPIQKIFVCTNDNDVLYEFFKTGVYDIRQRSLLKTHSPSMDILIASNLERLLYFMFKNTKRIKTLMRQLDQNKIFTLSPEELSTLRSVFECQRTSNAETQAVIQKVYDETQQIIDPHTATAIPKVNTDTHSLIVATASPFKFPDVYRSVFNLEEADDFALLDKLNALSTQIFPNQIKQLRNKHPHHQLWIAKEAIEATIQRYIKEFSQ